MEKELSLKEKFILLCYQPENGKPYSATFYHFGFIGTTLLELAEHGKIKTEGKLLKLTDRTKTNDKALDFVLDYLVKAGKDKKISYWIRKLSEFTIKRKLRAFILDSLVHKRILKEEEVRALLIFKYKKYPARETRTRNELIKEIQNLVLRNREGDQDLDLLVALIGATRMTNRFFEKKDRKEARKRIKELMKENKVASIVNETVAAVQAAILATIIASSVATSSASH